MFARRGGRSNRRGIGRAGGWNPLMLPGLQLWLDPSDASTVTLNVDDLSGLANKTSHARDFAQSDPAVQPRYTGQAINGRQAYDVDGVDEFLRSTFTDPIASGTTTLIAVVDPDTPGAGTQSILDNQNARWFAAYREGGSGETKLYSGSWGDGATSLSGAHSIVWQGNGASSFIRQNKVTGPTFTATNQAFNAVQTAIGAQYDGGAYFFDGRIGEILLCSPALPLAQIQRAEAYLSRWGV